MGGGGAQIIISIHFLSYTTGLFTFLFTAKLSIGSHVLSSVLVFICVQAENVKGRRLTRRGQRYRLIYIQSDQNRTEK